MLLVISPSKTQEINGKTIEKWTMPVFLPQAEELSGMLAERSVEELVQLMKISPRLAELTFQRYQAMQFPFTPENSGQALLVFQGAQFSPIQVAGYTKEDFHFAQNHLRIFSGLYGLLRPLDLMQPYRLEMATRLATDRGQTLYAYWRQRITEHLHSLVAGDRNSVLVNLASNEYFKVVRSADLGCSILKISFKEIKNGKAGVIAVYAKRARGMMVDYVISNRVSNPELLKKFDRGGYSYREELSNAREWVFTRKAQ
ncbi:MAG TPA: peroxide stress protein YaaA [Desulfobulbus sp.]|nr:peroxide stress protein YaaA [Desulfobulbus sp.]